MLLAWIAIAAAMSDLADSSCPAAFASCFVPECLSPSERTFTRFRAALEPCLELDPGRLLLLILTDSDRYTEQTTLYHGRAVLYVGPGRGTL